ncbi:hypothetical protein BPOR_0293g00080 [Botrytis porri]|uniref:Secreted protein n=1 Tax=Botrytis porri TaxID=87229 RepID=A0A4Z1KKG6_9HELO|nr:hypothetical protein BPOR_0293g00080 [Botrytis porri]
MAHFHTLLAIFIHCTLKTQHSCNGGLYFRSVCFIISLDEENDLEYPQLVFEKSKKVKSKAGTSTSLSYWRDSRATERIAGPVPQRPFLNICVNFSNVARETTSAIIVAM